MGKKADQMTPEELEAVRARIANLRAMANAKRMATAADKRETIKALVDTKVRELVAKKALVVKKTKAVEKLEKRVVQPEPESEDEPEPEPEPEPQAKRKTAKKKVVVMDSSSDSDDEASVALMKERLKQKYKQKYESKFLAKTTQAAPHAPQRDIIQETAREQLNDKVRKEVQDIAYRSVFGNTYW